MNSYFKENGCEQANIPTGYAMRHSTGGDVGFSWNKDDPKFGPEWERVPMIAAAPQAEQPQSQDCCDTPNYCSSVRRCTAKDSAPAQAQDEREAFERYVRERFGYAEDTSALWHNGLEYKSANIEEKFTVWMARAALTTAQPAQKPEDKAEQQEPVAWLEAEEGMRGKTLKELLTPPLSVMYSSRWYYGPTQPQTKNPVWPLYAHPSPASTHQQNVSKTGQEIDRLSELKALVENWEAWAFSTMHDERNHDLCDFIQKLKALLAKGAGE